MISDFAVGIASFELSKFKTFSRFFKHVKHVQDQGRRLTDLDDLDATCTLKISGIPRWQVRCADEPPEVALQEARMLQAVASEHVATYLGLYYFDASEVAERIPAIQCVQSTLNGHFGSRVQSRSSRSRHSSRSTRETKLSTASGDGQRLKLWALLMERMDYSLHHLTCFSFLEPEASSPSFFCFCIGPESKSMHFCCRCFRFYMILCDFMNMTGMKSDMKMLISAQAAFACQALLQGLSHLHSLGIIHRDVKPANILIANGGSRVVLSDLGLATWIPEGSTSVSRKACGTRGFLAPECLLRDVCSKESDMLLDLLDLVLTDGHGWSCDVR